MYPVEQHATTVYGFFEEVIEKVESEELAENLRTIIIISSKQRFTDANGRTTHTLAGSEATLIPRYSNDLAEGDMVTITHRLGKLTVMTVNGMLVLRVCGRSEDTANDVSSDSLKMIPAGPLEKDALWDALKKALIRDTEHRGSGWCIRWKQPNLKQATADMEMTLLLPDVEWDPSLPTTPRPC